jgi:hypothetical protein
MFYSDECHATKIMYFPGSSPVLVKFDECRKKNVSFGEQTTKFYITVEHQPKT